MRAVYRATGLLLLVVVAAAHPARAATTVIQPSSQDAYISKDKPNRIAGANPTNTRIRVLASPPNTQVRRGLVQFPLGTVPVGSTINSATVGIYAGNNALNPTLTHGLHRITTAWLQSAVKWNNAPPFVAAPTSTAIVGDGRGFKSFDVTPDVQAAILLCAADHGWLIKDQAETATNDAVNYIAKEEPHPADLPNRPMLTIDFTPPPCTTNADCVDTNFCTTNERCESGVCVVDAVNCDDANPCTDDICDCSSGCINANICNDGFTCTIDTCDPDTLACTNTPVDAVCTGECSTGTCLADPDDNTEDPVTGCVVDTQQPDGTACTSDGVPCTADQCQSGQCVHPTLPDASPCEDGDLCTTGDVCNGGACMATPVVCSPAGQCFDTGTCNPLTGVCSNPPKANGASCDDGDACTQTDQCDGAGQCDGGNPVVCTALDDCHEAGTCDSGTGICSNPLKPNGESCSDGNTCTINDTCLAGSCVGDPMSCGDGMVQPGCNEQCDGGDDCTPQCRFICGPVPKAGCKAPVASGKATVLLKDKSPDKKDVLNWRWVKGDATALSDFGTPLSTTGYVLCVYDQSPRPQPLLRAFAPAGGTCGPKPCWSAPKGGFKYKDKLLDPDGIQQITLKSGAAGKAKVLVKGKADNLPTPSLPLTPTVTVQLKNDAGFCWEAEYSTPKKNQIDQFKAKAD